MPTRVSVVVPVKDGAAFLGDLLAALAREGVDETLVIDSGSHDGSQEIARASTARVLEIAPGDFGHGRTRNLGAERTSGDVIAFLTQDATPCRGWRAALLEAFALSEDVGVVFGPHLPRPDTSPMIARELTEFFATVAPAGTGPRAFRAGDPTFLSNVNAAYRRACWEEIRFPDVPYSEDQAFGVALAAHPRWTKVYDPGVAVLHAHDYGLGEFIRRYFDEYRGLRKTTGYVEPVHVRGAIRDVRDRVAGDRAFMSNGGLSRTARTRWTLRSVAHHAGRKVAAVAGSRSERLPASVQRALSLERRVPSGPR